LREDYAFIAVAWVRTRADEPRLREAAASARARHGFVPNLLQAASLHPERYDRHRLALCERLKARARRAGLPDLQVEHLAAPTWWTEPDLAGARASRLIATRSSVA